MSTYLLYLDLPGEQPPPIPVVGDSPAQLAAAVHTHARPRLGSRTVSVHLDGLTGELRRVGSVAGTFTLAPVDEPDDYGWTLHDLDRLARTVVSNNRAWWPAGDRDDLYAAAWHGIVEHLYTTETEPRRTELMEAGRRALGQDVKDNMRHHGARRDSSNNGLKYAMYWEWAGRSVPSPENGIVERLALAQILPALTTGQRQAVEALAVTGDYDRAAQLIGSPASLTSQLMKGRRRFRELWHEGEVPSGHWGCDRRAGTVAGTVGHGSALARLRRRARTAARKTAGTQQ
ncbi:hypothetical protein [Peterkaempfera griseoplana]|uniref:hypothetical protein n=1 Tax=Peterkaempfera griseoplana TaxID=66896 RepID=UPI0006E319A6|nr:hypothetical protein [Peterkaempfera griseoplana]